MVNLSTRKYQRELRLAWAQIPSSDTPDGQSMSLPTGPPGSVAGVSLLPPKGYLMVREDDRMLPPWEFLYVSSPPRSPRVR